MSRSYIYKPFNSEITKNNQKLFKIKRYVYNIKIRVGERAKITQDNSRCIVETTFNKR